MMFHAAEDITYLQYLIFYESLETQYKKAYDTHEMVQEEIDRTQFEEEEEEKVESSIHVKSSFSFEPVPEKYKF